MVGTTGQYLPLCEEEKVLGRKNRNNSSAASGIPSSPTMIPLLPSSSSSASSSRSASSPWISNAFLVKSATGFLWLIFGLLEGALSLFSFLCNKNKTTTTLLNQRKRTTPGTVSKTVVIVGGNFAGLAALRELQTWQQKRQNTGIDLHIVLIDTRQYSEYTPGILRLFCDPEYFFKLAQALPEKSYGGDNDNGCSSSSSNSFERIQGTVTSIVPEDVASPIRGNGKMETVLTYVPSTDDDPNSNGITNNKNSTLDNTQVAESAAATRSIKTLNYDYLILATGATYNEPISPATPTAASIVASAGSPTLSTTTMLGRYEAWNKVHARLKKARRVLILGGGAVGVELAAEILDHDGDSFTTNNNNNNSAFRTTVTIVDASPTLVPLFPRSVGAYAEDWLSKKGAELRLGESLLSWNDRSCTLQDGTILHADIVYVCFGNRPNSDMVGGIPGGGSSNRSNGNKLFSLTRRRNVVVKDTLQLVLHDDADGDNDDDNDKDGNGKYLNTPWFACGDVAGPPTNDEKQAFQAEMQGKLAARNVIQLLESSSRAVTTNEQQQPTLLRYPMDIAGADRIPLVFVLSLGRYDGVLGFNSLCLPGSLAAIVKWILEHTKVSQMRGRLMGNFIWKIGDAVTLFLSRTLFRPEAVSTRTTSTDGVAGSRSKPVNGARHDSAAISTIPLSSTAPQRHAPAPHKRRQHRQLEEQLKLS